MLKPLRRKLLAVSATLDEWRLQRCDLLVQRVVHRWIRQISAFARTKGSAASSQ